MHACVKVRLPYMVALVHVYIMHTQIHNRTHGRWSCSACKFLHGISQTRVTRVCLCVFVCLFVCLCVREREREREKQIEGDGEKDRERERGSVFILLTCMHSCPVLVTHCFVSNMDKDT